MTLKINDNGTDRDMTETEMVAYQIGAELAAKDDEAIFIAQADAAHAKSSASAKLAALGLTAAEIAALVG